MLRRYTPEDRKLVESYMSKIDTYSYFYSSFYIEIWKEAKKFYLQEGEYGLYIYSDKDKAFFMPLSDDMYNALEELVEISKENNVRASISPVDGRHLPFFELEKFRCERDAGQDEYIYDRTKLETLSGKSLQSKRNHISRFKRENPDYTVRRIEKRDHEAMIALAKDNIAKMPETMHSSLNDELSALICAIDKFEEFDLDGLLIEVDGKLAAYTIAQRRGEYAIIHFEKALQELIGAYQTINQEYLKTLPPEITLVNRQEDLGLEGLKKAKLSYKPIGFIEKYTSYRN